jgi:hypothetical protein
MVCTFKKYFFDISWHIAICTTPSFCVTAKLFWMCQPFIHSSIFMWQTTVKLYISFHFSEGIHSVDTMTSNSRYCSMCYRLRETQVTHYEGKERLIIVSTTAYVFSHTMLPSCVLHCALTSQTYYEISKMLWHLRDNLLKLLSKLHTYIQI